MFYSLPFIDPIVFFKINSHNDFPKFLCETYNIKTNMTSKNLVLYLASCSHNFTFNRTCCVFQN